MVREFELPDVGEGLTEAEVVSWLVEPGDTVSEDQPVAEVETDKAVVEVPAPVDGTVREIRAEEGEMVKVGTVIITFDTAEQSSASRRASADDVEGEAPEPEAEPGGADTDGEAAGDEVESAVEPADEAAGAGAGEAAEAGSASKGGRTFAAPSARRLARELGVDIGTVSGSGPGGRVTEQDVRAAAESGDEGGAGGAGGEADEAPESATEPVDDGGETAGTAAGAGAAAGAGQPAGAGVQAADVEAAGRDKTLAAPATRRIAKEEGVDIDDVPTDETRDGEAFVTPEQVREYAEAQQAAQAADAEAVRAGREAGAAGAEVAAAEREERVPYRGIRRTIGDAMETSKYTAPHVTHHDDVDVTQLVEVRSRLKEEAEERGIKLTYMPFVMKAVVAALKEYPVLNSQLDEENERIVKKHYYNIGVATATEAGLMVPVVEDVDRKGMLQIASEVNELANKARDRSISREEMQGGTFSITNFGAIGGEYATPIINYPETAILGLGAIKDRPRVVDSGTSETSRASGEAATKEVVPRKVMTLSLSIDHRVIDGAEAAAFTNTLKRYLENPELLLLE
jgi:pyruvate dehydrogenase E2 component (dihydrolipoamide acetyltransferase)